MVGRRGSSSSRRSRRSSIRPTLSTTLKELVKSDGPNATKVLDLLRKYREEVDKPPPPIRMIIRRGSGEDTHPQIVRHNQDVHRHVSEPLQIIPEEVSTPIEIQQVAIPIQEPPNKDPTPNPISPIVPGPIPIPQMDVPIRMERVPKETSLPSQSASKDVAIPAKKSPKNAPNPIQIVPKEASIPAQAPQKVHPKPMHLVFKEMTAPIPIPPKHVPKPIKISPKSFTIENLLAPEEATLPKETMPTQSFRPYKSQNKDSTKLSVPAKVDKVVFIPPTKRGRPCKNTGTVVVLYVGVYGCRALTVGAIDCIRQKKI